MAYVDEEGWFYADEETINAVDETIAWDDEEYAQQVITYTEARNALARARIARGFYPVVVPADDGRQPRFDRASKKGAGKGKRKGKGKKENLHLNRRPSQNQLPTDLVCHQVRLILVEKTEEKAAHQHLLSASDVARKDT